MPVKPTIPRRCESCQEPFLAKTTEVNRGHGRFCSRLCQRSTQARINAAAKPNGPDRKQRKREWLERTGPKVNAAHHAVDKAKRNGLLVPQPCEKCGKSKVDAHHDDYEKPLEVRWLCRRHHLLHHRNAA